MWERWFAADSYYSHGILIPFVSMYLIWQQRKTLSAIEPLKGAWGMPLIILGMAVHILSSLFRIYFTSGFSMLIVLTGLVLHFYGWRILRSILFPVIFLMFMVPIPMVVIANISFKMKLFAAQIATAALNNAGLPAIREGSIIKMQHAYVIVDDVCSGLRSLIALTALGGVFAYGMKSPMSRRILLFLSTIPIAIVTNVVRVVFLASVSEIWGSQYAAGFIHDLSGFAVFALAFLLLYAAGRLLE
jgi:exosortase